MDGNWIKGIISKSKQIRVENESERQLIQNLIYSSYKYANQTKTGVGKYLAASFDLVVAADYYSAITHTKWLYCPGAIPDTSPRLYYHFTNCCPPHVLQKEFVFSPANKPPSGKIGRATSRLLLNFYQQLFEKRGRNEKILKGCEPVDIVIIDESKKMVIFAEIKASPLLTLPLSMPSERLYTEKAGERVPLSHQITNNTSLFEKDIQILVPVKSSDQWSSKYFTLGRVSDIQDSEWAQKGILGLLQNDQFLSDYYKFWFEALRIYPQKEQLPIFWFTNACGTPSPVPPTWAKRRVGSGYESVSDTKTSVGMDRTDDIKKGIFQTLKLGSLGKPLQTEWIFRVALISNIHAARHFDEYLGSMKDIVWTLDAKGNAKKISDLPPEQDIYNLCDGIVALTTTISRDEWISELFNF